MKYLQKCFHIIIHVFAENSNNISFDVFFEFRLK
jgi:hypothetical protein